MRMAHKGKREAPSPSNPAPCPYPSPTVQKAYPCLPCFSVLASACAILYIYQRASGGSGPCAMQKPSFWKVVSAFGVAPQA